jgi:hypothetical protein
VSNIPNQNNAPTVEDIGLTSKDIHEGLGVADNAGFVDFFAGKTDICRSRYGSVFPPLSGS